MENHHVPRVFPRFSQPLAPLHARCGATAAARRALQSGPRRLWRRPRAGYDAATTDGWLRAKGRPGPLAAVRPSGYVKIAMEHEHLVGGLNSSEKYEFVKWDEYSPYMEKNVPNHQPAIYSEFSH